MASARLQITVESACNLYNSDGVLAGKSDPYVIVEVPGQEGMKFQTEVISNELNPVWNFTGEIEGFMDGDILRFTVMDKDTFPKPDDFLGKAELTAQDFYPNGFHGELMLADSKTQATLTVMIVVVGCDEAAPEMVEGEGAVQMMVPGEAVEGTMVAGPSSAAVYTTDAGDGSTFVGNPSTVMYSGIPAAGFTSGVAMHGLPVYSPGVATTTTTTSQPVTYSAPQTYSVSMNGAATTAGATSQPMTYAAPQTYSTPMSGMVTTNLVGSQSMASQSMTYAAPQAPESVAATGKVIVHPPVVVTAEEFARINGTIVTEPLPVTVGMETVGAEANREVVINNVESEAMDKTVKIKKKKKTKQCC